MPKAKSVTHRSKTTISNYVFDTSKYIVMTTSVRRDSTTGRLTTQKPIVKVAAKNK